MVYLGLSHARALTPISDPIHVRFELNLFDRVLVDSPYFQRLHFILQSSTNFVSFPSNKNTRFPHSLGVSHIAGRQFSKGLSQSSTNDLTSFLHNAGDFISRLSRKIHIQGTAPPFTSGTSIFNNYEKGRSATISGLAGFLHKPLLRTEEDKRVDTADKFGKDEFPASFIVDTYWQALRLCSLMHDIGHLPMSHAFEAALHETTNLLGKFRAAEVVKEFAEEYDKRRADFTGFLGLKNQERFTIFFSELMNVEPDSIRNSIFLKAFHEIRGIYIYNKFISDTLPIISEELDWSYREEINQYAELVFYLSIAIILSTSVAPHAGGKGDISDYAFLYSIRKIFDGEVDADRLDYTLRDCLGAGSKLGTFDLERVISNSVLLKKDGNNIFSFGFYFRAISGIEQFYEQRYSSYKYIIFHRTASRSNKCLEALIALLLTYSFKYKSSDITNILVNYRYLKRGDEELGLLPPHEEALQSIDDSSLRTMLFEIRRLLSRVEITSPPKDVYSREAMISHIKNLLEIVLLRQFQHVYTAFKNISSREVVVMAMPNLKDDLPLQDNFLDFIWDNRSEIIDEARKDCLKFESDGSVHPTLLVADQVAPKLPPAERNRKSAFEDEIWILTGAGKRQTLASTSASVRAAPMRFNSERQLRIYFVSENIKSKRNLIKALEGHLIDLLRRQWHAFASSNSSASIQPFTKGDH